MALTAESTFDVEIRRVSGRETESWKRRRSVAEMKDVLERDGFLISPILIRLADHNSYRVVAGATRFLAAKALSWTHIRAALVFGTFDELKMVEVSENLSVLCCPPMVRVAFVCVA